MRRFFSTINRYWRIVGTGFSFAVFGLGALFIGIFFSLFVYPLPINSITKRHWTRHTISRACWLYVRMMRVMGLLTFNVQGAERLKSAKACLVVANHPSLLDVVFLLSLMPDTNCVVKEAMAKNPFTFAVVSMAGYILNSGSGEDLVEQTTASIQSGQQLIIFPEGTRTRDPQQLMMQRGAANIALKADCPILPVIINCEPMTLRKYQPWYDVPLTPPHFSFVVMHAFDPHANVDKLSPSGVQARVLTRFIQATIEDNTGLVC